MKTLKISLNSIDKVKGNIMKFQLKTLAKSEKIKTTKRMIEVKYE